MSVNNNKPHSVYVQGRLLEELKKKLSNEQELYDTVCLVCKLLPLFFLVAFIFLPFLRSWQTGVLFVIIQAVSLFLKRAHYTDLRKIKEEVHELETSTFLNNL